MARIDIENEMNARVLNAPNSQSSPPTKYSYPDLRFLEICNVQEEVMGSHNTSMRAIRQVVLFC